VGTPRSVGLGQISQTCKARVFNHTKRIVECIRPLRSLLEDIYPSSFLDKIYFDPNTGCWLWIGAIVNEYGQFAIKKHRYYAHRFAYKCAKAPIPSDCDLHHYHCETPPCVNPAHTKILTRKQHQQAHSMLSARYAVRSHCKNGHAFTVDNVRLLPNRATSRICKQCVRINKRNWRARRRARRDGE
jgi:hypothetical protein